MLPTSPNQNRFLMNPLVYQYGIAIIKTITLTTKYHVNASVLMSNPTLLLERCLVKIPPIVKENGVTIPNTTGIHVGRLCYIFSLLITGAAFTIPERLITTEQIKIEIKP